MPNKKKLTEKNRVRAIAMLIGQAKPGVFPLQLPSFCISSVAKKFVVARAYLSRLCARALLTRFNGVITSPFWNNPVPTLP
jgi:hypothetical protein